MGERYWITGVQLGTLQVLPTSSMRRELINEIVDKQFIGDEKDLKKMLKVKK
jgi:hypothetical protein